MGPLRPPKCADPRLAQLKYRGTHDRGHGQDQAESHGPSLGEPAREGGGDRQSATADSRQWGERLGQADQQRIGPGHTGERLMPPA
jgi:hypothetical protein